MNIKINSSVLYILEVNKSTDYHSEVVRDTNVIMTTPSCKKYWHTRRVVKLFSF